MSIALVMLAACGRVDRAPGGDSLRVQGPRAVPPVGTAALGGKTYPGALTKPIDAYSGDELYELVHGLAFVGTRERERRCRGVAGCDGVSPSRRTLVQVGAVATQDSLNAADLSEFGVVQARAINRGQAVEARYGFRPGGAVEYYLIVQRDSTEGMRWRLEELETTRPRRHLQIGAGRVVGCGHPWTPGARADFRTCDQVPESDSAVTTSTTLHLDAPLWVDCNSGCCVLVGQDPGA